tara:strand:+ start:9353 stop:10090 length:738 start_codon:yes stop_codon:yes gene_type:complete
MNYPTRFFYLTLALGYSLLFLGCGHVSYEEPKTARSRTETIDFPKTNGTTFVPLGEPMLRQGTLSKNDSIELTQPAIWETDELEKKKFTIYPGPLDHTVTTRLGNKYRSAQDVVVSYPLEDTSVVGGLIVDEGEDEGYLWVEWEGFGHQQLKETVSDIKIPLEYKRTMRVTGGELQELIYSGRSDDDTVNFLYREFDYSSSTNLLYQEIYIDLDEGNMINIKNAKVEVLKATNEGVEYRVIKGFI